MQGTAQRERRKPAVSCKRMPPTALTNTSDPYTLTPVRLASTAMSSKNLSCGEFRGARGARLMRYKWLPYRSVATPMARWRGGTSCP